MAANAEDGDVMMMLDPMSAAKLKFEYSPTGSPGYSNNGDGSSPTSDDQLLPMKMDSEMLLDTSSMAAGGGGASGSGSTSNRYSYRAAIYAENQHDIG